MQTSERLTCMQNHWNDAILFVGSTLDDASIHQQRQNRPDGGGLEGERGPCPRQTAAPGVSVTQLQPGPGARRVGRGGCRKWAEGQVAPGPAHTSTGQKTVSLRSWRHSPRPRQPVSISRPALAQTAPPKGWTAHLGPLPSSRGHALDPPANTRASLSQASPRPLWSPQGPVSLARWGQDDNSGRSPSEQSMQGARTPTISPLLCPVLD